MATATMAKPSALASKASVPPSPSRSGKGIRTPPKSATPAAVTPSSSTASDTSGWGANFWVTLVDPFTGASFYACPGTGQVSWDAPENNFVVPPSETGEWWELMDETRDNHPYFYHTKTKQTVWERPDGFVIPLGILQSTAAGKRLSWSLLNSSELARLSGTSGPTPASVPPQASISRSKSHARTNSGQSTNSTSSRGSAHNTPSKPRRSAAPTPSYSRGHILSTIPGSPDVTEGSGDDRTDEHYTVDEEGRLQPTAPETAMMRAPLASASAPRPRSRSFASLPRITPSQPQSLTAAVEVVVSSASTPPSPNDTRRSFGFRTRKSASSPDVVPRRGRSNTTEASRSPIPETPTKRNKGKQATTPVPALPEAIRLWKLKNGSSTAISSPMPSNVITESQKIKAKAEPFLVGNLSSSASLRPILPRDLVDDIQQFIEEDFAKHYFSTHRAGFIFKRKTIPLAQVMTWQKAPMSQPLLQLNRALHKDAIKIFRIVQRVMGDRELERPHASRAPPSTSSLPSRPSAQDGLYEEERWLLGEGITHGELRDEIYCQVMKQLNGNPSKESVFKGWQFMCVVLVAFPPSKNFETSLRAFIQMHAADKEGRIDVLAKHCLKKLDYVSKKGPRGKPLTVAELESASDAAFNPSIFGESLSAILRLQERTYPTAQVPIVLNFLADGILALGGARTEGIFRVPGDTDAVLALRVRVDRGQYALGEIDDPHVPGSLLKMWLRELREPVVPHEMYDACVRAASDPAACIALVRRLPAANRRVLLFVVSFLQLFLDERTQEVTKMGDGNLALVMAPNLLRCESDSMAVVFTNANFENNFVRNLLIHLKPDEIDPDYKPAHGMGAKAVSRKP